MFGHVYLLLPLLFGQKKKKMQTWHATLEEGEEVEENSERTQI